MAHRNSRFRLGGSLGLGLALAVLGTGPAGASITGVCPDGSIFIVKREADIPCSAAKLVEPHEVPPIKPEFLPRPYAWEVFNQKQDPNNPYNLVDKARQVRDGELIPEDAPDPQSAPQPSPAPAVSAAPPPAQLVLSLQERRDIALIVELAQERVRASFERSAAGTPTLIVRLAHSPAFQARLHAFWVERGQALPGPVVLFSAEAVAPDSFYANFTFAQGSTAFHAEASDPRQFALIEGALGALAAGDVVLGYVALPAGVDVAQPMDVYWNDRRLAATLRPQP
jgi:hypothetical protein